LAVVVGTERAPVSAASDSTDADIELPAEAFIRLVYGRLDTAHTPPGVKEGTTLDQLRTLFPGV